MGKSTCSRKSTAMCEGDCAAYCANGEGAKAEAGDEITTAGQTPASTRRGCNPWCSFVARSINLREEQTTNWRAGCRKSASPVREEGRFYPVPTSSIRVPCRGLGVVINRSSPVLRDAEFRTVVMHHAVRGRRQRKNQCSYCLKNK